MTCGSRGGGQGRGRTADLPLFRRTLVPTELPAPLRRQVTRASDVDEDTWPRPGGHIGLDRHRGGRSSSPFVPPGHTPYGVWPDMCPRGGGTGPRSGSKARHGFREGKPAGSRIGRESPGSGCLAGDYPCSLVRPVLLEWRPVADDVEGLSCGGNCGEQASTT